MEVGARIVASAAAAVVGMAAIATIHAAERMDSYQIGAHGQGNVRYPAWFKTSFLDLREDLAEARAAGRRGIVLFFSQKNCNHCQAFVDVTLADPATRDRVRAGYDVVALDIFNDVPVTGIDGKHTTIRDLAQSAGARFTPTLVFFGVSGAARARLVGFYPPEKFNRVLDYLDGGHDARESLPEYLARTAPAPGPVSGGLRVDYDIFERPPLRLQPAAGNERKPMVVIFDQANCPACARFHERVLSDAAVRDLLRQFRAIIVDRADSVSRLVNPAGRETSPAGWARELGLVYEPSVLFFDRDGLEVHRIDAEAGKDRVTGSLQYVLEEAYREHDQFLRWRREKARAAGGGN